MNNKKMFIQGGILLIIVVLIVIMIFRIFNNGGAHLIVDLPITVDVYDIKNEKRIGEIDSNRALYYYGVNAYYETEGNLEPLYSAITSGMVSIDDLIKAVKNKMEDTPRKFDDGTQLYTAGNVGILVCDTKEGNKDIYIGDDTLDYEVGFCTGKENATAKKLPISVESNIVPTLEEIGDIPNREGKLYYYGVQAYLPNSKTPLYDALKNNQVNMDDIITEMDKQVTTPLKEKIYFDDGGTVLYLLEDVGMIVCNSVYGSKDIYIGNSSLKMKEGFCGDD